MNRLSTQPERKSPFGWAKDQVIKLGRLVLSRPPLEREKTPEEARADELAAALRARLPNNRRLSKLVDEGLVVVDAFGSSGPRYESQELSIEVDGQPAVIYYDQEALDPYTTRYVTVSDPEDPGRIIARVNFYGVDNDGQPDSWGVIRTNDGTYERYESSVDVRKQIEENREFRLITPQEAITLLEIATKAFDTSPLSEDVVTAATEKA